MHITRSKALSALALGLGASAASTLPVAAQEAPQGDPAVIQTRVALSQQPHSPGYQDPADVTPESAATGPQKIGGSGYKLYGVSRAAGYVGVFATAEAVVDFPGPATTTAHIYGNALAARDGDGYVKLTTRFTCTGAGISGVSLGAGGSITGGVTSTTATLETSRTSAPSIRQFFEEDGHFKCKASNLSPAKTTHFGRAQARYKNDDTYANDDHAFWW
jgi:hypothetical protein